MTKGKYTTALLLAITSVLPAFSQETSGVMIMAITSPKAAAGGLVARSWNYENGFGYAGAEVLRLKQDRKEHTLVSLQGGVALYLLNDKSPFLLLAAGAGILDKSYAAYGEGGAGVRIGKLVASLSFRTGASKYPVADMEGWYAKVGIHF